MRYSEAREIIDYCERVEHYETLVGIVAAFGDNYDKATLLTGRVVSVFLRRERFDECVAVCETCWERRVPFSVPLFTMWAISLVHLRSLERLREVFVHAHRVFIKLDSQFWAKFFLALLRLPRKHAFRNYLKELVRMGTNEASIRSDVVQALFKDSRPRDAYYFWKHTASLPTQRKFYRLLVVGFLRSEWPNKAHEAYKEARTVEMPLPNDFLKDIEKMTKQHAESEDKRHGGQKRHGHRADGWIDFSVNGECKEERHTQRRPLKDVKKRAVLGMECFAKNGWKIYPKGLSERAMEEFVKGVPKGAKKTSEESQREGPRGGRSRWVVYPSRAGASEE